MCNFENSNGCTVTYETVRTAMDGGPFTMSLTDRDEIRAVQSFFAPFGRHIPYEIRNLTEDLSKAMKA